MDTNLLREYVILKMNNTMWMRNDNSITLSESCDYLGQKAGVSNSIPHVINYDIIVCSAATTSYTSETSLSSSHVQLFQLPSPLAKVPGAVTHGITHLFEAGLPARSRD